MKKFAFYVAAAVVLTVAYYFSGGTQTLWQALKPTSTAVTILGVLHALADRFLWRLLPVAISRRPYVGGTWKVSLKSYKYDEPGQEPRVGFLVVKQTFSSISAHFITRESESHTLTCDLKQFDDQPLSIFAVYRNEPRLGNRNGVSQMHFGGMQLKVRGDAPSQMDGHYWTDRTPQSSGEFNCVERKRQAVHSYDEGLRVFGLEGSAVARQPDASGAQATA